MPPPRSSRIRRSRLKAALVGGALGEADIDQRPQRRLAQAALADPGAKLGRLPRHEGAVLGLVARTAPRRRVAGPEPDQGLQQRRAVDREEEPAPRWSRRSR